MNNGRGKVSVIIPTYNRAKVLKRALESVLEQSYRDLEVIIVDDGSTDNTAELISSIQDDRIRYYYTQINSGAAAARNYGLQKAEGEYIAFQDSDDIWYRDKLQKQMSVMTSAGEAVGAVYHKIMYDLGNDQCAVLPNEEISVSRKSGDIYAQMLYDNLIPCPSILMKRECVEQIGMFDSAMKALEDYDFALKLARNYRIGFIDEILLEAALSTDGVSQNVSNYLVSSCIILGRYREDYLRTDNFNRRVEIILRDAEAVGIKEQVVGLLEKILQGGM